MSQVTVVVPTRNRREVLSVTLGAIAGQRGVDPLIVVVDEGSSDDTPDYLAQLEGARLEVVRHDEPKGLAAARNAGLARVTTPWVAFCDDDDIWAPDKLSAQLAEVARVPGARWSVTGTISVTPDLDICGHQHAPESGDIAELMQCYNAAPGGGSATMIQTQLAQDLGGYDPWPTGCEDYDLATRLATVSPVAAVDRPLVAYRVWPGSMSTNVARMRTGHLRVLERHRQPDLDRRKAREGDLRAEQYWARFHLRKRDRRAAMHAYTAIATRYRLPKQLGYALWGGVAPASAERHQARLERAQVPEAWKAEVAAWLLGTLPLYSLPA